MRDVVRGDKHNLRKSANCKAQLFFFYCHVLLKVNNLLLIFFFLILTKNFIENTQWWNIQQKREQTTLWTLTNEKCGPTTKAKTEKKTSRKEREGGGKRGENKIKLESVEERRARFKREASNTGRERERERKKREGEAKETERIKSVHCAE